MWSSTSSTATALGTHQHNPFYNQWQIFSTRWRIFSTRWLTSSGDTAHLAFLLYHMAEFRKEQITSSSGNNREMFSATGIFSRTHTAHSPLCTSPGLPCGATQLSPSTQAVPSEDTSCHRHTTGIHTYKALAELGYHRFFAVVRPAYLQHSWRRRRGGNLNISSDRSACTAVAGFPGQSLKAEMITDAGGRI